MNNVFRDRVIAAVGGHYLVESEIGRGGMAAVFRALDMRLNRYVAIKALPPELAFNDAVRSRFIREAQMAARLTHPHIVPIFSVDELEGISFFVMALVDGDNIATHLKASGPFDQELARSITAGVADALDFAHKQGVVHRDIKPDNILLDRASRRAMVTDFGIARAAAEEHRLTLTGMAMGTPAYMSPEQAMGERDVDGRSDIYSLGVVAYQMLAGETPFKATNTPAMLMKHVSEPPPSLLGRRPDLPADLVAVVERCLAKRPEERWQTGGELKRALLSRSASGARDAEPRAPARAFVPAAPLPPFPPAAPIALPASFGAPRQAPWEMHPPAGLSRRELKKWERDQRDAVRKAVKKAFKGERTDEERIASFRKNLVGYGVLSVVLFVINAASGGFPWFFFPVGFMGVSLVNKLGGFWGDGIPMRKVFFGLNRVKAVETPPMAAPALLAVDAGLSLAPPEILSGPHGAAIHRAASSSSIVMEMLARLSPREREMLPPDVERTVRALLDRVVGVGTTLHRLDSDANGTSLGSLDARLTSIRAEPDSPDKQRRLALLERQRATLGDLVERRSALLAQFESASVALENLKLDLVRFRSAGVSSALEDVTSATREARAVSRDIEHMLEAQDEARKL